MNEKIILYIDGQLSREESIAFGKEIQNSPSLQRELSKYRGFISGVKELSDIKTEGDYFVNMIPEFRKKIENSKKKKYHPKFAFATAVLAVIIVMFMFLPQNNITVINNYSNITESDIRDYFISAGDENFISNLPEDSSVKYDSLLDGMIYSALSPSNEDVVNISVINKLDYNTLIQSVSNDQADMIYKNLINKKIY